MSRKIIAKLKKGARKHGYTGKQFNRYVYGGMQNILRRRRLKSKRRKKSKRK